MRGEARSVIAAAAPAPAPARAPAAVEVPKPERPKAPVGAPAAPKAPVQAGATTGDGVVTAPMPGTISDILVKEGDRVARGQVLVMLEAMKMQNEIMAGRDGVVESIHTSKGASVNTGDPLLTLRA
ncbi:MAG: biotin/lipoyl-binding protein [Firmicutes bacterium]|nr:biotin/lipoyl-binding protein [Bacillota bacterium]